jgi:exodeoxyribonuclease VII small subunit
MILYVAFRHQVKTLAHAALASGGRRSDGPVRARRNVRVVVRPGPNSENRMAPSAQPPKDFESALAELESIVTSMEGGQLPLQASLSAYKRGAELVAFCQAQLKDAQQQIEILEQGVLKSFAPDGSDDGS